MPAFAVGHQIMIPLVETFFSSKWGIAQTFHRNVPEVLLWNMAC